MHIKMRLLRTGNKKKILKAVRETRYKHRETKLMTEAV